MLSVNEINLLQSQNEGLKKQNKELQQENTELKAENERLKEKIESYVCSQNCYAYKQADKYRHILQEIKAIVGETIIAYTDIAQSNEKLKALDLRSRLQQILQKITKAEEE